MPRPATAVFHYEGEAIELHFSPTGDIVEARVTATIEFNGFTRRETIGFFLTPDSSGKQRPLPLTPAQVDALRGIVQSLRQAWERAD